MKRSILFSTLFLFGMPLMAQDKPEMTSEGGIEHYIYSIYFGGGSHYVDEAQEQGLYEFLQSIPNIENYAISVHSYTDDIGGVAYNQWLSENRSESVIQKIETQSIDREQISIQDFGMLNPIYDNSTWEGKLKNRRTDVILIPLYL